MWLFDRQSQVYASHRCVSWSVLGGSQDCNCSPVGPTRLCSRYECHLCSLKRGSLPGLPQPCLAVPGVTPRQRAQHPWPSYRACAMRVRGLAREGHTPARARRPQVCATRPLAPAHPSGRPPTCLTSPYSPSPSPLSSSGPQRRRSPPVPEAWRCAQAPRGAACHSLRAGHALSGVWGRSLALLGHARTTARVDIRACAAARLGPCAGGGAHTAALSYAAADVRLSPAIVRAHSLPLRAKIASVQSLARARACVRPTWRPPPP